MREGGKRGEESEKRKTRDVGYLRKIEEQDGRARESRNIYLSGHTQPTKIRRRKRKRGELEVLVVKWGFDLIIDVSTANGRGRLPRRPVEVG